MVLAVLMSIAAQAAAPPVRPVAPPAPPVPVTASPAPPPLPPPPRGNSARPHKGAQMINLFEVFQVSNYPFWALKSADEGQVEFRVSIDAAGRAVACEIVTPAEAEALNRPTCDLVMAQARFTPATDRRGRPIPTNYQRSVRWQLENAEPWPMRDSYSRVVIAADAAGKPSCEIEQSPGEETDPRSCALHVDTDLVREWLATPGRGRALVFEESGFVGPDADARVAGVGKQDGESLRSRSVHRVTINAAGKAIGCEIVEVGEGGEAALLQSCDRSEKVLFAPEAGDGLRRLVVAGAVYER